MVYRADAGEQYKFSYFLIEILYIARLDIVLIVLVLEGGLNFIFTIFDDLYHQVL